MPTTLRHINLFRLWIVMVLLCTFPFVGIEGKTHSDWHDTASKEECIAKHDGLGRLMMRRQQEPLTGTILSAKNTQRVDSSRPVRLHPTSGGKQSRNQGRWTGDNTLNPTKHFLHYLYGWAVPARGSAASPRFYYVIALRRILC